MAVSSVSGSAATTKRKDPTNGKSATVKLGKRKGQPASYTTANPAAVDVGPSRPQPPAKRPRASSPLHQSKGKSRADSDQDSSDDSFVFTSQPFESSQLAPVASTSTAPVFSPRGTTRLHPLLHEPSQAGSTTSIALNTAETPKIQRNKALRNGDQGRGSSESNSQGPPSASRRGRRGSSIGSGQFEATPHHSVPDDALYKHIDPNEPPAIRFLTLSAWTARRARDLHQSSSTSSKSRQDVEADRLASQIMESWIQDLCSKQVDLSWPDADYPSPSKSRPAESLMPNPKNEALRVKMQELEDWTARAAAEDEVRRAHMKQYSHLRDAGARAAAAVQAEASQPLQLPLLSLPLDLSSIRSSEDILQVGRDARTASTRASDRQRRRSGLPQEPFPDITTVDVQREVGIDLSDLRHQASLAKGAVHRLEQLVDTARAFTDQRLARVGAVLAGQRTATPDEMQASGSSVNKQASQTGSAVIRALVPPSSSATMITSGMANLDIAHVLRAISREDLNNRRH